MPEYVTQPDQFLPERWLKQPSDENILHPFASLPYGHGARMCLGRRFADLEMQILLAKVSIATLADVFLNRILLALGFALDRYRQKLNSVSNFTCNFIF